MILLGLGSNMGDREQNLQQSLQLLAADGKVKIEKLSSIYETSPFGVTDQADFLNMVVRVKTHLAPAELLAKCLEVEQVMGRIRTRHWGPRIIDIDLLIYDDIQMQSETLTLPHPGIVFRTFVLVPMRDVAPKLQLEDGPIVEVLVSSFSASREHEVRLWRIVDWDSSRKCFV